MVYIEGRLRTRSWEDKENQRKFATEVVGDNLIMLDKRTEGASNFSHPAGDKPPDDLHTPPTEEEDLRF